MTVFLHINPQKFLLGSTCIHITVLFHIIPQKFLPGSTCIHITVLFHIIPQKFLLGSTCIHITLLLLDPHDIHHEGNKYEIRTKINNNNNLQLYILFYRNVFL